MGSDELMKILAVGPSESPAARPSTEDGERLGKKEGTEGWPPAGDKASVKTPG